MLVFGMLLTGAFTYSMLKTLFYQKLLQRSDPFYPQPAQQMLKQQQMRQRQRKAIRTIMFPLT